MAKIIKLNENDLKRIVTKVLTERQEINGIFVKTLNNYAKEHKMLMPISQEEIREAEENGKW